MPGFSNSGLSNIPLPTEKDSYKRPQPVSPFLSGGLPDLKSLFKHIKLDDILLFGLIILIATDDDCDNFLLILLAFVFLAGFDSSFFNFLK